MKVYSRFTLWIILASASLTVAAGSMLSPLVHLVRDALGVDPASVGFILTTHALFVALFSPLMGSLTDKIGAKKPFVFGLVLYGLAGGSGLFIDSYWLFIASRAILGIGVAAMVVSMTVMILNVYEGVERNKVMGWRASANSLGIMILPLIGGILGTLSWHLPFAVYLLGIPLGFLALITIPGVHREKIQDMSDVSEEGSVLKFLINNRILFVIYGLRFLSALLLYVSVVFLSQFLEKFDISNPFYISLFFATSALSGALTSLVYGRIKSRLSYKMIVLTVLALWAVAFTLISQATFVLIIAVAVVLFGIGRGMIQPALPVWAGETAPVSFRGRITSYLLSLAFIGQFSSPVLFGPVFSVLGLNGVFLVAGGLCATVFLLLLFLKSK